MFIPVIDFFYHFFLTIGGEQKTIIQRKLGRGAVWSVLNQAGCSATNRFKTGTAFQFYP